jgi:hypothetical protein
MTVNPEVLNIEPASRDGAEVSWLYRWGPTVHPEYLDGNDVDEDEWAGWHLRRTDYDLADLICTDVPGRVAKQLLQLAQCFGTQEGEALRVDHHLTHEEIAQLVGASVQTVDKALADFAHRGWIRLHTNGVLICDCDCLRRRAG